MIGFLTARLGLLLPAFVLALPSPTSVPRAVADDPAPFTQEQLDQMLAPLALYPDDLLSQILMACTYPLEIVQADRWVRAHADLTGDKAAVALEAESWDASVKSLVAVPDVLALLSEKLDWTQQLGDAFIAQQQQVLETVQALRLRAKEAGQLESSEDQLVSTEGTTQIIVIESASPDVIYVPVYDPTIVYGYWPYPAYPPYPYYPPHYAVGVGIAVGFAWGYAWGHCDWHGGDVDIDIDRNIDINHHIDRDNYRRNQAGLDKGERSWRHDPAHRGSVPYRDQATAKRLGGVSSAQATQARDSFRGRTPGDTAAGGAGPRVTGQDVGGGRSTGAAASDRSSSRSGASASASSRSTAGTRTGALNGIDRSGSSVRGESLRGQSSRGSLVSRGGSARGGGRGGGRGGRP